MSSCSHETIGIVAHDAGGAEVIAEMVLAEEIKFIGCLRGPAREIFKSRVGSFNSISCEELLEKADWLLCGTSWQSDLEYMLVKAAKESGKRVVSVLDHWVNYEERFTRNGKICLPGEIWVTNKEAEQIAKEVFANMKITIKNDYVSIRFRSSYHAMVNSLKSSPAVGSILFLSDNISASMEAQTGNPCALGYSDMSSLAYMIENLSKISRKVTTITIRLHPSEDSSFFEQACSQYGERLRVSSGKSLVEDLATHEVVAGSESMAMYHAVNCGKRVISCIPPGGTRCRLPLREIEVLSDIT